MRHALRESRGLGKDSRSHSGVTGGNVLTCRRRTFRAAASVAALLMLSVLVAACGSSSISSTSSKTATTAGAGIPGFKVIAGTDIPTATVRYGLLPYGDNSMPVIGMQKGWFKDVGIKINPQPVGSKVQDNQVVPKLVNDEIDMINWDGTVIIQTMTQAPDLKQIGFTDTYLGIYILAAPNSDTKTVSELTANGTSFSDAMQQSIQQLKGKKVALDNTGYHRSFFNTVFDLGGIKPSDMDLTTIDDAKMVQLAKAGKINFASPAGAAQNTELLGLGWKPVVGVEDLLTGLPPGDKRSVGTLDNIGPALNQKYLDAHPDTVLRAMSVNFRIVDQILKNPNATLPVQVPYLESVTGGNYTLNDLKLIYGKINPLTSFDQQGKYWTEPKNPQYYRNIYDPQIKALQKGGVLPKGQDLNASQVIIGTEIYNQMLALKQQYEKLAPDAEKKNPSLAAKAKIQAANFNYLDAARFALAATE